MSENALVRAVRDLERHESAAGWDRSPALFALVRSADLVRDEPAVASQLGLTGDSPELTPVAQDNLALDRGLMIALAHIEWPTDVAGAVLTLETVVLPRAIEEQAPATGASAWALRQPGREEARVVVGVLRDGQRTAAVRWRSHDLDNDVLLGPDLVPHLADALAGSLRSLS